MTTDAIHRISFHEAHAILAAGRRIVITTHVNPDGDAIGSEYALLHALTREGRDVVVVNTSPTPANMGWLNQDGRMQQWDEELHRGLVEQADVIVILDLNSPGRLASMRDVVCSSHATRIVIDHHLDPEPFADAYCVREDACATSEVLYDLIAETMPDACTPAVARGLYTGIMTDTGSFRFPNTSAKTHDMAAHLMRLGVDAAEVAMHVFDEFPIGRALLLGHILTTMDRFCDNRATMMRIDREVFHATGTTLEDTENLVNFGLSFQGARATALLTEGDDGTVKISLRGRDPVAIVHIARQFGGGGHRLAAGATVVGRSMDELGPLVRAALERAVIEASPS